MNKPSRANEAAFTPRAIDEISVSLDTLLRTLVTKAPPRDRETEMRKAQIKSLVRFGKPIPPGL